MFIPGTAAIERTARLGVHHPQRVEAAERQPRKPVGAACQHGIGTAETDRVEPRTHRHRARCAGGHDAGTKAVVPEFGGDQIDTRAEEMIPDVRRSGILDTAGHHRFEVPLGAQQDRPCRPEQDADTVQVIELADRPLSSTASVAAAVPNWSLRDRRRRCRGVKRVLKQS